MAIFAGLGCRVTLRYFRLLMNADAALRSFALSYWQDFSSAFLFVPDSFPMPYLMPSDLGEDFEAHVGPICHWFFN